MLALYRVPRFARTQTVRGLAVTSNQNSSTHCSTDTSLTRLLTHAHTAVSLFAENMGSSSCSVAHCSAHCEYRTRILLSIVEASTHNSTDDTTNAIITLARKLQGRLCPEQHAHTSQLDVHNGSFFAGVGAELDAADLQVVANTRLLQQGTACTPAFPCSDDCNIDSRF